jgi:hypothetical protein
VLAEADLEGLLPVAQEAMQDEEGHGDGRLHATHEKRTREHPLILTRSWQQHNASHIGANFS